MYGCIVIKIINACLNVGLFDTLSRINYSTNHHKNLHICCQGYKKGQAYIYLYVCMFDKIIAMSRNGYLLRSYQERFIITLILNPKRDGQNYFLVKDSQGRFHYRIMSKSRTIAGMLTSYGYVA